MKNAFISDLNEKDVNHCTTDFGLLLRKKIDKPFKKICNVFTNANIIKVNNNKNLTDEEYFKTLAMNYIDKDTYPIKKGKNNIVVERYPELNKDEPYIFVCNHTCPEDIETVLNILDRNAYLILGSIESLKYNPEMYLTFLNGMIPFDIMDKNQRKLAFDKMKRVLKTNSILIFPEGSHNYSPNNLINNLFDGPVNLALQTGRKIVAVTLSRDGDNNISYMDVSNPIDVTKLDVNMKRDFNSEIEIEKYYVNSLSKQLRDKMATSVYCMAVRHFKILNRENYDNIEEEIRMQKIKDAFKQLKWNSDVFDAEYLVKKTKEEKEQEEVVKTESNLTTNPNALKGTDNRSWVLYEESLENKDVANRMRQYWMTNANGKSKTKVLRKK